MAFNSRLSGHTKKRNKSVYRRKTCRTGGKLSNRKDIINDIDNTVNDIITKSDISSMFVELKPHSKKNNSPEEVIEKIDDSEKLVVDAIESISHEIISVKNVKKMNTVSAKLLSGNIVDVIASFDAVTSEIINKLILNIKKNDDIFKSFDGDTKSLSELKSVFDQEKIAMLNLKNEYADKRKRLIYMLETDEPSISIKKSASHSIMKTVTSIFRRIQSMLIILTVTVYLTEIIYKKTQTSDFDKLRNEILNLKEVVYQSQSNMNRLLLDSKIMSETNYIEAESYFMQILEKIKQNPEIAQFSKTEIVLLKTVWASITGFSFHLAGLLM